MDNNLIYIVNNEIKIGERKTTYTQGPKTNHPTGAEVARTHA